MTGRFGVIWPHVRMGLIGFATGLILLGLFFVCIGVPGSGFFLGGPVHGVGLAMGLGIRRPGWVVVGLAGGLGLLLAVFVALFAPLPASVSELVRLPLGGVVAAVTLAVGLALAGVRLSPARLLAYLLAGGVAALALPGSWLSRESLILGLLGIPIWQAATAAVLGGVAPPRSADPGAGLSPSCLGDSAPGL